MADHAAAGLHMQVEVAYKNIKEVRTAPRAFGLWGDCVIFLKVQRQYCTVQYSIVQYRSSKEAIQYRDRYKCSHMTVV
jgi:hypothetical protein